MPFCQNCGTKLMDGAKFCPECGVSLRQNTTIQTKKTAKTAQDDAIQSILKSLAESGDKRLFIAPDIPSQRFQNALDSYVADDDAEFDMNDVLLLVDNSLIGNGKEGLFILCDGLYGQGEKYFHLTPDLKFDYGKNCISVIRNGKKEQLIAYCSMAALDKIVRLLAILATGQAPEPETDCKKFFDAIESKKIFIYPDIPEKKLQSAIQSYAGEVSPEEVLILIDGTMWGSAKNGILITKDAIYRKDFGCEVWKLPEEGNLTENPSPEVDVLHSAILSLIQYDIPEKDEIRFRKGVSLMLQSL